MCRKGSRSIRYRTVFGDIPVTSPRYYQDACDGRRPKTFSPLHDVLKEQGWQENQPVTFLTDGGDTVRNMAQYMAPASEQLLDWFHITMRITVMHQYVKGLSHANPDGGEAVDRLLRQIKGYLWNGNLHDGRRAIEGLVMELEGIETDYAGIKARRKAAGEFDTYIRNNAGMIPNYAERRRCGERVSTGFVESAINTVVGKRFDKRQQMRCSKGGEHLMLQARTRTLDACCGGNSSSGTQD